MDEGLPERAPGEFGGRHFADRPRHGRHGAGGYAVDRHGADRPAAHGYLPGRHGADDRDVDDRYVLDAGARTSARYDDPVGDEPGRHGSRHRPGGYARPASDDVDRFDRGQPEQASDEFGSDGYAPDRRDPDDYASDEYEYDTDDETVRLPASGGRTGRRRAPDDSADDAPAATGPGREAPHRRARTERGDERPTRRRRWPWVVGGVAAAAAVVPLGLAVLGGGTEEQRGASQTGSVAGLGTSPGTGQPGVTPSAAGAAPQAAAAQVVYEVTGSGSASTITISRGTSVTQYSDTELPWKQTAPAVAEPAEYSLTAAGGSGKISCKIVVGDAVVAEETSEGEFAAISCSGRR